MLSAPVPRTLGELSSIWVLSSGRERGSTESSGGSLLAPRALEADWKHGNTPRREGASFLVIKLSGQIQMCMRHTQKAIITQDLAFFTCNLLVGNGTILDGRECVAFSFKLTDIFSPIVQQVYF